MKVLKLVAENFKRLSVVEIAPEGSLVQISGKNDVGKTTVLDAIWAAIAGADHIQSVPIRKGADKGRIRLELGDQSVEMVVERKFTQKGGSIVVENAEGLRHTKPQAILDSLYNALCIDPIGFLRQKPKDQFAELMRIAAVDIDLSAMAQGDKADYEARTTANRNAAAALARAQGVAFPPDTPAVQIDEDAIVDELTSASEVNAAADRAAAARTAKLATMASLVADAQRIEAELPDWIAQRQADLADTIADLERQIREHKSLADEQIADRQESVTRQVDENRMEAARLEEEIDAIVIPEKVDASEVRARLDAAKAVNANVTLKHLRDEHEIDAKKYQAEADKLTARMDARKKTREDALGAAKMPVAGLGFGDGEVTFNGLPIDQASTSQQIRIGMAIAMAQNPKLRVIRIKDGSVLDEDNLKLIGEIAGEKGYQVWIEVVDSTGTVGIVMEDGHVKGKAPPLVEGSDPASATHAPGANAPEVADVDLSDEPRAQGDVPVEPITL